MLSGNQFALDRLTNLGGAAEGTNLPPRQAGELRVPIVTNLRILRSTTSPAGQVYTLGWSDPETMGSPVIQYNVFVIGANDIEEPQGPYTARRSPVSLLINTSDLSQIRFVVQTQLQNGMTSNLRTSPSVAVPTASRTNSVALAVRTVTATECFVPSDFLILGDTTSASFSVCLPATPVIGMAFELKKAVAANTLTLDGNGYTIDGAATVNLIAQYSYMRVVFNGSEWSVI